MVAVSQAKVRREMLELVIGHVAIADKLPSSKSLLSSFWHYY